MKQVRDNAVAARARVLLARTWRVVVATIAAVDDDRCFDMAALLAFYLLLALFPGLLVLVALLGYLPVDHAAATLLAYVGQVAPAALVDLLATQLALIRSDGRPGLATLAMLGALWSSSAAMRATIEALNRAYRVPEWRRWWHRRLVALGLTLAFGLFMTFSLVLLMAGPQVIDGVAYRLGARDAAALVSWLLRWPAMAAVVVVGIDLVYHFAPNRFVRWSWTTPGALLATALWVGSSLLFKLYVTNLASYSVTYGAIGGVIVVLLWLYLSSMAILVGAELNSVLEREARSSGATGRHDRRW